MIARELLPAGREALEERFTVRSGGLDTSPERLRELVPGAAAIVPDASVPVDQALLAAAGDSLRVVANFAVGYDNVDLDACREAGIVVTNTPDVLTNATAEMALTLTLAAARRLSDVERTLRGGEWRGWDPGADLGWELSGSTVGIVGLGRIGTRYAELLAGFGCEIIHSSRSKRSEEEARTGATRVELEELLRAADVVSIHAPATPETRHLISERELALMKPSAILVNTARGSLVDLDAVAAALHEDSLGAAGIDVYEEEPNVPASILDAPRTVLAPHVGSATQRARDGMARTVARNVIAVLGGEEAPNRVL